MAMAKFILQNHVMMELLIMLDVILTVQDLDKDGNVQRDLKQLQAFVKVRVEMVFC